MTLPDANSAMSRKIKVLKSMCSIPGEYVKCSSKAVSQKKFQEVKLHNYPKVIEIYRSQFFTSLVANLEKRLLDNFSRSSHEKAKTSSKTESHTDLIQDVKVLFKKDWPSEINIRYGEESVSNLCELF
jgi:hypothetical protein